MLACFIYPKTIWICTVCGCIILLENETVSTFQNAKQNWIMIPNHKSKLYFEGLRHINKHLHPVLLAVCYITDFS